MDLLPAHLRSYPGASIRLLPPPKPVLGSVCYTAGPSESHLNLSCYGPYQRSSGYPLLEPKVGQHALEAVHAKLDNIHGTRTVLIVSTTNVLSGSKRTDVPLKSPLFAEPVGASPLQFSVRLKRFPTQDSPSTAQSVNEDFSVEERRVLPLFADLEPLHLRNSTIENRHLLRFSNPPNPLCFLLKKRFVILLQLSWTASLRSVLCFSTPFISQPSRC